jgi:hypothetical protein
MGSGNVTILPLALGVTAIYAGSLWLAYRMLRYRRPIR